MQNKKIVVGIVIVLIIIALGFLPVWTKAVRQGYIKINTWDKILTSIGWKYID